MSLNWNIAKVKDYKTLTDAVYSKSETQLVPATDPLASWLNSLVWGTLAVDLGEITEDNIDEWLFRLAVLKERGSEIASNYYGPVWPDRSVLVRFIGLNTNVSNMTRKKWLSKQAAILERKAKDVLYYERDRSPERVAADALYDEAKAEDHKRNREALLVKHADAVRADQQDRARRELSAARKNYYERRKVAGENLKSKTALAAYEESLKRERVAVEEARRLDCYFEDDYSACENCEHKDKPTCEPDPACSDR